MAPKAKIASIIQPTDCGTLVVQVVEVDVSEESGWRELNQGCVDELLKDFLGGNYGINVLKDVMVRGVSGEPNMSKDQKSHWRMGSTSSQL